MSNNFRNHVGHGFHCTLDKITQPLFIENYKTAGINTDKTYSPKNSPPILFPDYCLTDFEHTTQSNSVILTTVEELKQHFALNYGLSYMKGMFSKSERLSKFVDNSLLALSRARFSTVSLVFQKESATLLPQVVEAIGNLPENYDSTSYANFIATFGTHYITRAEYGGLAELRVITEPFKAQTVDPKVLLDYSIQLMVYILTTEGDCPTKPILTWQTDMHYDGGDISLMLGKTDINKWQASFANNPYLVNMYAEDIYTIPGLNENRKANLKKAIEEWYRSI